MIKHKAYINSNYFQIKIKEINCFTSKSIKNGKIINKKLFINDYKQNINNKNIFSISIDILLNKEIEEQDILYYTNIFEELNYTKINIISTSNYLDNNTMIPNEDYYIMYNNKKYYNIYPFQLNDFIKSKSINKLKIISKNNLNLHLNCKIYYYTNIDNFFIK